MSNMVFDPKTGEIIERGHSDGGGYKLKWYDKHGWIALWIVLTFIFLIPCIVMFYALVQSRTINKFWKWFWFVTLMLYLLVRISNTL